MQRTFLHVALAAIAIASLPNAAISQQKTLKDQLTGTWTFVSWEAVNVDGSVGIPIDGIAPKGQLIFTDNGRFSFQVITNIPKFRINDRLKATPEENNAVARGSLSQFGTFTVNETDRSFTLHIERSTFANQNDTDNNKRVVTSITADELKYTNFGRAAGGQNNLVWKRSAP